MRPILALALITIAFSVAAQQPWSPLTARAQQKDSNAYELPARMYGHISDSLDSVYKARRATVSAWVARQNTSPISSRDFVSLYAELGGLIRTSAADINQYFSERSYRPNSSDDRSQYRSADRDITLGAEFRLSRSWGVFVQYEFAANYYNTIIDSIAPANARNLEEALDLTEHSLVTGGMVLLYEDKYYQLRALGGIGGVYAIVSEEEPSSGATRSASASGLQLNFDLVNEFRIGTWGSALIDLLTRSTSTGTLKTSDGQTLAQPFGSTSHSVATSPDASKTAFGFAVGLRVAL